MKTMVVTSCTGEKLHNPEKKLLQNDFIDSNILLAREQELDEFTIKASQMYTGLQHLRLMEGISILREQFGAEIVDLIIVSAGYGLIKEDKIIAPYEVTFNTMNSKQVIEWANFLKIHEDLSRVVSEYDMVLFLLGDSYLRALQLPIAGLNENQKLIFIASKTSRKLIPDKKPYYFIEIGQDDASSFSYGLVGLKGYLFKLLSQELVSKGEELFSSIFTNPYVILDVLEKYRRSKPACEQLTFLPSTEDVKNKKELKDNNQTSLVKQDFYAKNYGHPIKYFIPEWNDRVDPRYDFITDIHTPNRDPYCNDVYAHEIYEVPNYDGILVSKIVVEETQTKKARIEELGIHKFVRFPQEKPIMGDCGAFGYINEYEPPYTTEEILGYYDSLGFNIGVSIDHLIIGNYAKDKDERERRYKITRENAYDFIRKYNEGNHNFLPSGVAQGWDPESYRDSVSSLVDMGYKHISIGGLALSPTPEILDVLRAIAPVIPDYMQVHLFGVLRLEPLLEFRKLGVTSFDSASYLRKAWLSSGSNYFSLDGQKYAAIRIPQTEGSSVKVKKMIKEGRGTIEQFKELEQRSLEALRRYDAGEIGLEDALNEVLAYDELIGEGRSNHSKLYRKVLEDKPWKKCNCKICRETGIEVIIFRGNNRNRRRGFHNTYVFYQQFKDTCK